MIAADEVAAAERSVVGECIFNPATVRLASAIVTPDDFGDLRLGGLFGLIAGMVSSSGPEAVTALTVAQEVTRRKAAGSSTDRRAVLLPDVSEIPILVTTAVPGAIQSHARQIREAAVIRSLAAFGRRTTQAAESGEDPATLASAVVEQAKAIRDGHRTMTLTARTLGAVLSEEDADEYDWVIPGLLEVRDRLMITGAEGLGKSTFFRQLAVCTAGGVHPFTGQPMEAKPVLYVDVENSERQWRRKTRGLVTAARMIGTADPEENMILSCIRRLDITTAGDLGAIHSLIDDYEPSLVVIGPMYRLVPRAIMTDDDAAPVLAALDSIRDRGPAIALEAHAGHAIGKGGERDYRPRGSAALLGWPEFGFGLAPDETDEGKSIGRANVIRWRGDRDERDWPNAIRRGGRLPWTDDRREPSDAEHAARIRARYESRSA